jgi:putative addiction module component (TIGR02574 family)
MTQAAEQVLEAAMALSETERAEVASALWESIEEGREPALSPEWQAEIARRIQEIDAGQVQLLSEEDVNARLSHKYGPLFD